MRRWPRSPPRSRRSWARSSADGSSTCSRRGSATCSTARRCRLSRTGGGGAQRHRRARAPRRRLAGRQGLHRQRPTPTGHCLSGNSRRHPAPHDPRLHDDVLASGRRARRDRQCRGGGDADRRQRGLCRGQGGGRDVAARPRRLVRLGCSRPPARPRPSGRRSPRRGSVGAAPRRRRSRWRTARGAARRRRRRPQRRAHRPHRHHRAPPSPRSAADLHEARDHAARPRGAASRPTTTPGLHPEVLARSPPPTAVTTIAYGEDHYTAELQEVVCGHFGDGAVTWPVFNGTGANVVALQALLPRWGAVVCAETAHIHTDEGGAPERVGGIKLLPVPTPDGKLTPELDRPAGVGFRRRAPRPAARRCRSPRRPSSAPATRRRRCGRSATTPTASG